MTNEAVAERLLAFNKWRTGEDDKTMSAGKGDKPRNCFSKKYKSNFDEINWGQKKSLATKKKEK
jgi:hypothetical protein